MPTKKFCAIYLNLSYISPIDEKNHMESYKSEKYYVEVPTGRPSYVHIDCEYGKFTVTFTNVFRNMHISSSAQPRDDYLLMGISHQEISPLTYDAQTKNKLIAK